MRKISGQLLSAKPISLPYAARIVSRFTVDNSSTFTPAVSLYLERTSEALNHFVQFHKKRHLGDEPDRNRVQKLKSDWLEKNENPDEEKGASAGEDTNNVVIRDRDSAAAETNPTVLDEPKAKALSDEGEEENKERKTKKKNKKRKSESVDSGERKTKSSKKRKSTQGPDS